MAWLTGWQYRALVKFQTCWEILHDYQQDVVIPYSEGKMRQDFGDIRFTDSDGETLLDYHLAEKVDGVSATFVVKIPLVPDEGYVNFYAYTGNPSATTTSDPESVYIFYDDFENGSIDSDKWEEMDNPSIVTDGTNKVLRLNESGVKSVPNFQMCFKVQYRLKFHQIGAYGPRLQAFVKYYNEDNYFLFEIQRGGGVNNNRLERNGSTLTSNTDDWSSDAWYNLEIITTNNDFYAKTSTNQLLASSSSFSYGKILFYTYDGNIVYLDQIRVRLTPTYLGDETGESELGLWLEEGGSAEGQAHLKGMLCVRGYHQDFKGTLTIKKFSITDLRAYLYVSPYIRQYKKKEFNGELIVGDIGEYYEAAGKLMIDGIYRKLIPVRGRVLRVSKQENPTTLKNIPENPGNPPKDDEISKYTPEQPELADQDDKIVIVIGDGIHV